MFRTVIDNELVHVKLEQAGRKLFIHVDQKKWSPSAFKECVKIWRAMCDSLDERGIGVVYASITEDDVTLQKYASMFNFTRTSYELREPDGTYRGSVWSFPTRRK